MGYQRLNPLRPHRQKVDDNAARRRANVFVPQAIKKSTEGRAVIVFSPIMSFVQLLATTSVTSGNMERNRFSIPSFKVTVLDGQPLQAPRKLTVTIPFLKESS